MSNFSKIFLCRKYHSLAKYCNTLLVLCGYELQVLVPRPANKWFEPHRRHCIVSLSKNINPSLVLVQPRKTRPFITERLLMGRKESNQTNKNQQISGSVVKYLTQDIGVVGSSLTGGTVLCP